MALKNAGAFSPFLEDRILYLAARQDFGTEHAQAVVGLLGGAQISWKKLLDLAHKHHVAPLVWHNLEKIPNAQLQIPVQVQADFKRLRIDNILLKKDARLALEQAVMLFNQAGIEILLVKGAALNLLIYAQPWYTLSWDIDLVTRLKRSELDPALLEPLLAQFADRNASEQAYITKVEYDFYSHHDTTINGLLPLDMERIWADARPVDIGSGQAWVMSPEDLLVSAAVSAHRKRFFMLKNLCDIREIMYHYPGLDWQLAAQKAKRYQCAALVYTALQVAGHTLGAASPPEFFADLHISKIQAAAIDRLVGHAIRNIPLERLSAATETRLLGRRLSWPLLLTYTSYQPAQAWRVIRKLVENAGQTID